MKFSLLLSQLLSADKLAEEITSSHIDSLKYLGFLRERTLTMEGKLFLNGMVASFKLSRDEVSLLLQVYGNGTFSVDTENDSSAKSILKKGLILPVISGCSIHKLTGRGRSIAGKIVERAKSNLSLKKLSYEQNKNNIVQKINL